MDRRRRRAQILRRARAGAGLALTLAASAALASDTVLPIRAMAWLAPGTDLALALSQAPAECLSASDDPARARSIEIGRAAFRTPLLLGGQAARAGLSCESCHAGGRDNPRFHFPGASGAPGTADVTTSLFSRVRGNAAFDPRPIPDLAGPRDRLKVAQSDLPGFIRGLVVEEFDGPPPPPAVLAGLADYVAALDPAACPATRDAPVTLAAQLSDARRALAAAATAPDGAVAVLMISAAREALRLVDERHQGRPAATRAIRDEARRLARLQAAARKGSPSLARDIRVRVDALTALETRLARSEADSLYAPARLARLQPARP